jgi:FdhD protein
MKGEKEKGEISDIIVQESFLSVILNKEKVITLKCSPEDYDYLGIGFLYTSGILQKKEDISSIVVDEEQKMIKIKAKNIYSHLESSWRDGLIPRKPNIIDEKLISKLLLVKSFLKIESGIIFSLMYAMQKRAKLFKLTGGVHSLL